MSARHRLTAALATLLIALAVVPAIASARPAGNGPGPRSDVYGKPSASTPVPTVVRTVVQEDAVQALPIVLSGAALLIAIGGTGVALMRVAPLRQQLRGGH